MTHRLEQHNLDGRGSKRTHVYEMPAVNPGLYGYWSSVTDVRCPIRRCTGTIRWAEACYVPGYRICDECHQTGGTLVPTLIRMGNRKAGRS